VLGLDVDGVEAVDRVLHRRQVEALRFGAGEAAVAVGRPLHGRAHAVAVTQVDVVPHADLVTVIDDGGAGHGHEQRIEQLDLASVVVDQRRQPAADAQVNAGVRLGGVEVPQVVAFAVGDHLQRQFIVVAQEDGPLRLRRDVGRLAHDVGDRVAVLLGQRHVHARHHGEVEGHVALVALALAEVGQNVLGPLVGLAQEHAVGIVLVQPGAQALDDLVGLRKVLVVGALALHQVGDGVEPHPVDPHVQPELHGLEDFLQDARVVEVQVWLVAEEAVPVVLLGDGIPGLVGRFGVAEDDARLGVLLVVVRPDVEVAGRRSLLGVAGLLEPGVLVGGVVDDQLGDHL